MTERIILARLLLLLTVMAPIAAADGVTWTLENLTLSDGATATGSFVYDASTNTFSSIDIVTSAGALFGGGTYTAVDPGFGPFPFDVAFVPSASLSDLTNTPVLELEFFTSTDESAFRSLTNAGSTLITVTNELNCANSNCSTVTGEIRGPSPDAPTGLVVGVPVPEPSTLLLLGSALLGLMFMTRRTVV